MTLIFHVSPSLPSVSTHLSHSPYLARLTKLNSWRIANATSSAKEIFILFYPIQFQTHLHKNHIYTLNAWACPLFPSTVMEIADTAPSNAVCTVAHFPMVFTTDETQGLKRECFSSRNTDRISGVYILSNNSDWYHHLFPCFISCIWILKRQIPFS